MVGEWTSSGTYGSMILNLWQTFVYRPHRRAIPLSLQGRCLVRIDLHGDGQNNATSPRNLLMQVSLRIIWAESCDAQTYVGHGFQLRNMVGQAIGASHLIWRSPTAGRIRANKD
ncbi:hypothetical protein V6N11_073374 [Hibiscus sabdariffa]|uniref:Uncharacterized protein n=1 Tax=Hibiscus sabdariffa TaxID=183260 RepID=A0ABR2P492_9ROSI